MQRQLKARNPRITPPRVVTGPIRSHGAGGLRQLPRGNDAPNRNLQDREGAPVLCLLELRPAWADGLQGPLDPMDKLDALVTTHLADRLLQPERLTAMLAALASRRAAKAAAVRERPERP